MECWLDGLDQVPLPPIITCCEFHGILAPGSFNWLQNSRPGSEESQEKAH
jgi:hypothetical protein